MTATPQTNADIAELDAALDGVNLEETVEATDPEPQEDAVEETVEAVEAEDQVEDDELAELEGLEDLDLSDAADEDQAIEDDSVLDDEEVAQLGREMEKQEAYQKQVASATVSPEEVQQKSAKKSRSKGKARQPKMQRDLNSLDPELFVTSGDVSAMSDSDKEAARSALIAQRPTQVKVAEKFDNLFVNLAAGKAPSRYVMLAFDLLDQQKTVTSTEIIAKMKAAGLGDGTARSQTGQVMTLLPVLGVADRAKQQLTLRSDSRIAQKIREVANSAAS